MRAQQGDAGGDVRIVLQAVFFGLRGDEFSEFAASQFRKRYERISKARDRTLAEIDASSDPADVEDLVAEV